jgi:hypothetical protein
LRQAAAGRAAEDMDPNQPNLWPFFPFDQTAPA